MSKGIILIGIGGSGQAVVDVAGGRCATSSSNVSDGRSCSLKLVGDWRSEGVVVRLIDVMGADDLAVIGLQTTGYPYPADYLADYSYVDVAPRAGDLISGDGRYVHAVTGGRGGRRLLFNRFARQIDSQTIVYWT